MTTTTENETPEEPQEPAPNSGEATETESGNREAARYRTRLREVETERDGLVEQLASMRRAEVERLASDHLAKPAALWAAGVELTDLLDEAGSVDPQKVAAAAEAARNSLGLAQPGTSKIAAPPGRSVDHGLRPGPKFADAFKHPRLRNRDRDLR